MFEEIISGIKKDLGPLTPNWFEELTLKASRKDGKDVEKAIVPEPLCHADVTLKPLDVEAEKSLGSQASSPKPLLPSSDFLTQEHEQYPAAARTPSLTESSPCLFDSAKKRRPPKISAELKAVGGEDTPKRFLSDVQRISESLGAQINPDLSWSSSFETPSSLTPTTILSKRQEGSTAVKTTEERTVFVRKLFPPVFTHEVPQTSEEDGLSIQQDKKTDCSLTEDSDVSRVQKQRVPDAIEDKEVRTTVESVLDGAEDVLSFLFTSRSSSQRRRKRTTEQKRVPSPALQDSPQATASPKDLDACVKSDLSCGDVTRLEQISRPVKVDNREGKITQWSPLSLPENSCSSGEHGSLTESSVTKQHIPQRMETCEHDYASQCGLQTSLVCGPKSQSELTPDAPPKSAYTPDALPSPHIFRKPKKLVYSVRNSACLSEGFGQQFHKPRHQSPTKPSLDVLEGGQMAKSTQQETGVQFEEVSSSTSQVLPSSISEKDDVSQLSKVFLADFSEEVSLSTSNAGLVMHEEVPLGQNSSLPVAPKMNTGSKAQQSDPISEKNGFHIHGQHDVLSKPNLGSTRLLKNHQAGVSQIGNQNKNTTPKDDCSRTEFANSMCFSAGQSFPSFKTASEKTISIPQEAIKRAKTLLDEPVEDGVANSKALPSKVQSDPKGSHEMKSKRSSTVGYMPGLGHKNTTHPPRRKTSNQNNTNALHSMDVSGFKTAADKVINVSSCSLLKAKKIFEELEDDVRSDLGVQPLEGAQSPESALDEEGKSPSVVPPKSPADACSMLTASQRADVSELCNLLEEADSQCEFTQVKPTRVSSSKPSESAQQTESAGWDPDSLIGCNFDDSFHTDMEHNIPDQHSVFGKSSSDNWGSNADSGIKQISTSASGSSQPEGEGILSETTVKMNSIGTVNGSLNGTHTWLEKAKLDASLESNLVGSDVIKRNTGFRTAKGKSVIVSEKALLKAVSVLNDCAAEVNGESDKYLMDLSKTSMNSTPAINNSTENSNRGHMLASGKLTQETAVFSLDQNRDVPEERQNRRKTETSHWDSGIGFDPTGTPSSVSDVALHNERVQPQGLEYVNCSAVKLPQEHEGMAFSTNCFNTVTDKEMLMSTESDQYGKLLLTGIDTSSNNSWNEMPCIKSEGLMNETALVTSGDVKISDHSLGDPSLTCWGFSTANGKTVSVSNHAIQQAKLLLDEAQKSETEPSLGSLMATDKPTDPHSCSLQRDPIISSGRSTEKSCNAYPEADNTLNTTHNGDQKQAKYSHASFGFSTAGGKEVTVSKKALKEAYKLFEKCDETPDETIEKEDRKHGEHSHTGFGFSTAGGRDVSVSEKALKEAYKPFEKCDETPTETTQIGDQTHAKHSVAKQTPTDATHNEDRKHGEQSLTGFGFSTAGGKDVSVSSKALKEAHKLFQNCDETPTDTTQNEDRTCFGFSTAGGKDVSVSRKALKEAHKLFENCDETTTGTTQIGDRTHAKHSATGFGFSTAGGKDVSVSSKALQAAHKLFENCHETPTETTQNEDRKHGEHSRTVFGFSTAGGKDVSVSKKALKEAYKLFEKCDETTTETTQNEDRTHGEHSLTGFGFSTAGGKEVTVSKKALKEAHNLFENCDKTPTDATHNEDRKCFGFSTAGGKDVPVSKKALEKAHKLFENCDETTTETTQIGDQTHAKHSVTGFGFSTAGGKDVSVSKKALKEAHKLFEKCDETPTDTTQNEDRTHAKHSVTGFGFSTAGGKDVSVSKKALEKAHKLFEKCDETPTDTTQTGDRKCFGFSTAGGKDVSVSRNALKEAHKLFENCDESSTGTTEIGDQTHAKPSLTGFGFSTAGGRDVPVSKKALNEAYKLFEKCDEIPTDRTSDIKSGKTTIPSGQSLVVPPHSTNTDQHNACSKPPTAQSFGLHSSSAGLSNCTAAHQRYFEQEAMACAEALLEDDRLQKRALLGPSRACRGSSPEGNGRWKAEPDLESDSEDQPPKKRFLAESSRRLFTPLTSSPNGALSDRKVRCNVLLQPNITQPHRTTVAPRRQSEVPGLPTFESSNAKHSVEGMPVFVPPFRKQTNPECQKGERSLAHRAPNVFVPEHKTKAHDVQSSSHPAAESKGHPEVPVKRSSFVPVVKKTCHPTEACIQNSFTPPDVRHTDNIPPCKDKNDSNQGVEQARDEEAPNADMATDGLASSVISEKALECMQMARDMQDLRIRKKKRQSIRPLPGSVFLAKTSGLARISMQAAVGYKCPRQHPKESLYLSGVRSEVCQVSGRGARLFCFRWEHFFKRELLGQAGGVQLADGGWLISDPQGRLGKEQFYRALCDTPGVDPRLISEEWVYNHYCWIVWKRAAMERAFPREFGGLCLTPEQVLLQLKYRYDVEVDKSRRSALRRITEKDDSPGKTLVLCVCDVETSKTSGQTERPVATMWLTDGWYAIRAQLDPPLTALVQRGRLRVGMKLVTHGAELVGSQDACHPLEAPESLMLKISANSTRPARWSARLGYHRDPRPFRLPLGTLFSDGGLVSCVDFLVLRSYPIQVMEKTAGGVFIFRSERAEEREARSHEERKQKAVEALFSSIQAGLEKEEEQERRKRKGQKKRLSDQELHSLRDGEELHEAMESDPAYVQANLCEEQLASLCSFRRSMEERRQARLQERFRRALKEAQQDNGSVPSREVTPVWKLAVCDSNQQETSASKDSIFQLNIWRPSMELLSLLKEGGRYRAYHLSTSEGKRKTTAAVQLTATKKTRFEHVKVVPELLQECYQARQCVSFSTLQTPSFHSPCGEVDVMGYVIHITDQHGPSPVVYLADENMDFVSVRYPSALKQLAVEELVKPLAFLIMSNALLRQASAPIPSLSAGEFTLVKTSSVEPQIQEQMKQLKSSFQSQKNFFKDAEERLSSIIHPSQASLRTPKPPFCSNATTPVMKRPAPAACTSEEKHPKTLKRKRGFDYLSRIPSPPPLRPLGSGVSPHVKKVFNPPRRSERLCPASNAGTPVPQVIVPPSSAEDEWVKDEELALINM